MAKQPLSKSHPDLAKEWHSVKNGKLKPDDITFGSTKKVWWKCDKEEDHEWEATPNGRSNGRGCPYCAGNAITSSNCLAKTHPDLIKEWHSRKNIKITPYEVSAGSGRKVWWKCDKGPDHEWEASVGDRVRGRKCPICSNRKVVSSNCLANTYPDLASQWHPIKNAKLTPYDITAGSHKKVWWKCDKGPDHEWEAKLSDRKNGNRCPICSGRKTVNSNSLASTHLDLARQWHPYKNKDLTPFNVSRGSVKKVWWKCDKEEDHEWEATPNHRVNGRGCPICSGNLITKSNCLTTTHPDLAKEWHPTKNGKLTPSNVIAGSGKIVWWKCDEGVDHEWRASMLNRTSKNSGCAVCSGKKAVISNCLTTTHPDLAKEWHPTKNAKLTPDDITFGSAKRAWWKCLKDNDHEWKARINSRLINSCPYCTLTPQSKQELIITFELKTIFNGINPKGLKTRIDGKLITVDIYLPKLNLGIEFDGSYWHKLKREKDEIKTRQLINAGYNVIRIREKPLKSIFDNDIISDLPFNGKKVVNSLLQRIMEKFDVGEKIKDKIGEYLEQQSLQNEKGLERYIDNLLNEKAKKGNIKGKNV